MVFNRNKRLVVNKFKHRFIKVDQGAYISSKNGHILVHITTHNTCHLRGLAQTLFAYFFLLTRNIPDYFSLPLLFVVIVVVVDFNV